MCLLRWGTGLHTYMCFLFRCLSVVLVVWMTLNIVGLRHHWHLYLFWIIIVAFLTEISWLQTELLLTPEPPLLTGCIQLTTLIINDGLWLVFHLLTVLWPFRVEMHPLLWVALSPTENAIVAAFERRLTYLRVLVVVLGCYRPIAIKVVIVVWALLSNDTATRIGLQGVLHWLGVLIWISLVGSLQDLFTHIVSAIRCVFIAVYIYFTKLVQRNVLGLFVQSFLG